MGGTAQKNNLFFTSRRKSPNTTAYPKIAKDKNGFSKIISQTQKLNAADKMSNIDNIAFLVFISLSYQFLSPSASLKSVSFTSPSGFRFGFLGFFFFLFSFPIFLI